MAAPPPAQQQQESSREEVEGSRARQNEGSGSTTITTDVTWTWPFPQPRVWIQDGGWQGRECYEMHLSCDVPLKAGQMLMLAERKMLAREQALYPHDTITNRSINVLHLEPMAASDDEDLLQGHEPPKRKRNPRLMSGQRYRSSMSTAEFYYGKLKKSCFVELRAHHRALDILLTNKCILILGHEGDGKTTFGVWLLKKLAEKLDSDGLYLHNVGEYSKVYTHATRDPRITMIDDVLGRDYYSETNDVKTRDWEDFQETYDMRFNFHQYLIFTSSIFHYQRNYKDVKRWGAISDVPVFDLTLEENSFTFAEQKEILRKHCLDNYKPDLSPELPPSVPRVGYPGRVHYFVTREEAFSRGMSYWTLHLEPFVTMIMSFNHGSSVYFSILLYMVTNFDRLDPMDVAFFGRGDKSREQEKEMKEKIREEKAHYSMFFGEQYHKWLECLEHMKGIFVDWDQEGNVWKIMNDTIRLCVFITWGGRHFHSEFLRFVTRRFLVDHTYIDMRENERLFYARRHHVHFDIYKGKKLMARMLTEMLEGHVREMLLHRSFLEEEFVSVFLEKAREQEKVEDLLLVRNREDDDMWAEPLVRPNIDAREEKKIDDEIRRKAAEKAKKEEGGEKSVKRLSKEEEEEQRRKKIERLLEGRGGGSGPRLLALATGLGLEQLVCAVLLLPETRQLVQETWFQQELAAAAAVAESHQQLRYLASVFQKFRRTPRPANPAPAN